MLFLRFILFIMQTEQPNPKTLYYNYLIDHVHASRNATTYRSISNVYGEYNLLSPCVQKPDWY